MPTPKDSNPRDFIDRVASTYGLRSGAKSTTSSAAQSTRQTPTDSTFPLGQREARLEEPSRSDPAVSRKVNRLQPSNASNTSAQQDFYTQPRGGGGEYDRSSVTSQSSAAHVSQMASAALSRAPHPSADYQDPRNFYSSTGRSQKQSESYDDGFRSPAESSVAQDLYPRDISRRSNAVVSNTPHQRGNFTDTDSLVSVIEPTRARGRAATPLSRPQADNTQATPRGRQATPTSFARSGSAQRARSGSAPRARFDYSYKTKAEFAATLLVVLRHQFYELKSDNPERKAHSLDYLNESVQEYQNSTAALFYTASTKNLSLAEKEQRRKEFEAHIPIKEVNDCLQTRTKLIEALVKFIPDELANNFSLDSINRINLFSEVGELSLEYDSRNLRRIFTQEVNTAFTKGKAKTKNPQNYDELLLVREGVYNLLKAGHQGYKNQEEFLAETLLFIDGLCKMKGTEVNEEERNTWYKQRPLSPEHNWQETGGLAASSPDSRYARVSQVAMASPQARQNTRMYNDGERVAPSGLRHAQNQSARYADSQHHPHYVDNSGTTIAPTAGKSNPYAVLPDSGRLRHGTNPTIRGADSQHHPHYPDERTSSVAERPSSKVRQSSPVTRGRGTDSSHNPHQR